MSDNVYEGFEPRQDRVLVKPETVENKSAGGIILDAFVKDDVLNQGVVVAVSKSISDAGKHCLKVGDRVQYGLHAGFEVKLKGESYRLIRDNDGFSLVHD